MIPGGTKGLYRNKQGGGAINLKFRMRDQVSPSVNGMIEVTTQLYDQECVDRGSSNVEETCTTNVRGLELPIWQI